MSKLLYKEEYPDHLRHLYMAEAEKLKQEAWTNRVNRTKLRMKSQEKSETAVENYADAQQTEIGDTDPEVTVGSELTDSVTGNPEPKAVPENERLESWQFSTFCQKKQKIPLLCVLLKYVRPI